MFIKVNNLASHGIEIVDDDFTQVYHWDGGYFVPEDPSVKVRLPFLDAYERRNYNEVEIARNAIRLLQSLVRDNNTTIHSMYFLSGMSSSVYYAKYRSEIEKLLLLV